MQVLFDKVAIIAKGRAERQGTLYLAPSADEAMVIEGTVAASGPLAEEFVKEGDSVWFNKHNAFPVKIDGVEYRIISVKELLVVEPKTTTIRDVLNETAPLTEAHMPLGKSSIITDLNDLLKNG